MSIISDILQNLWDQELNYKGIRVNMFGVPTYLYKNDNSFHSSMSRMKNKGYIRGCNSKWQITKEGKEYLNKRNEVLKDFVSPFRKGDKKDLLIIFDIPESLKSHRDWLRGQLKKFGYEMVQKSAWAGPSPIPIDFKKYLKSIGLNKTMKTFKLSKPYVTRK
jgi:DNA-binding transcriptional regulator PaaX